MLVSEFIKRLKTYDPNIELTDEIINNCKTKLNICPYYSELRDAQFNEYIGAWVLKTVDRCIRDKKQEYVECQGNQFNENCLYKEGDKDV